VPSADDVVGGKWKNFSFFFQGRVVAGEVRFRRDPTWPWRVDLSDAVLADSILGFAHPAWAVITWR